jgi:hypothetical protein
MEASGQLYALAALISGKKPPMSIAGPVSRSEHRGEEKNFLLLA